MYYAFLMSSFNFRKSHKISLQISFRPPLLAQCFNLFGWICFFVLCWRKWGSYLRYVSPTWRIFLVFIQSKWVFCGASHTNWGMVFTVSNRKRIVTGVTDWGSEFTMWWSGTASINLSVILSWWWSLNTGCHSGQPFFTRPWLCLWETLILPPPVFWVPFAPSPAFISTLQAVPFQSIISSPQTLALWERGKEGSILRGVEFFYRSWHPWRSVTRHFALSFTLFFSSLSALLLKTSSFYLPLKSHSSLPSKPASFFSLLFQVFSLVCLYILLSTWVSCWSSGGGRASLRTHESSEKTGIKWPKKKKRKKKTKVWEGVREHFPSMHVGACVFARRKIRLGSYISGHD